jgi:hypothetical protein
MKFYLIFCHRYNGFYGSSGCAFGGNWFPLGSESIRIFKEGSSEMEKVLERRIDDGVLMSIECDYRGRLAHKTCSFNITPSSENRRANALNVEVGTPSARCQLQPPAYWNNGDVIGSRWLLSGGSPLVFGHCTAQCQMHTCDRLTR